MSKISSAKEMRSALPIEAMTLEMSRMMSAILRKSPLAVTVSTPTDLSIVCTLVLANCEKLLRNAVPANEPLMPRFANTPIAAAVSEMDSPAALACGPAIFKASNKSVKVCAEPLAVAVKISATPDILLASMPKIRIELAAILAASPRSVPVARARSSVGLIAASISFGENPILPNAVIPSATC